MIPSMKKNIKMKCNIRKKCIPSKDIIKAVTNVYIFITKRAKVYHVYYMQAIIEADAIMVWISVSRLGAFFTAVLHSVQLIITHSDMLHAGY